MQRIEEYRKKCEVMKQIESNRANIYRKINTIMNLITIVVSGSITFLGFCGFERVVSILSFFHLQTTEDIVTLFYNVFVFFLFLLTIIHLVWNFNGKQNEAERNIYSFSQLINEIDDMCEKGDTTNIASIISQYRAITRDKGNSDREYLRAKKQLAKKKREKSKTPFYADVAVTTRDEQERYLKKVFENDDLIQNVLNLLVSQETNGVKLYLGGGVIRDRVWDRLSNYKVQTPIKDIDVIYFDATEKTKERDEKIEAKLTEYMPNMRWSVKNQARMHTCNNDSPYVSLEDAVEKWPERASAVLVRKDEQGTYSFIAPFGYDDLLRMIVRPTPHFESKLEKYKERINSHNWESKWKSLIILYNK